MNILDDFLLLEAKRARQNKIYLIWLMFAGAVIIIGSSSFFYTVKKDIDEKIVNSGNSDQGELIGSLNTQIKNLEEANAGKDQQIQNLKNALEGNNDELLAANNALGEQVEDLKNDLNDRDNTITNLQKTNAEKDKTIQELEDQIANKDPIEQWQTLLKNCQQNGEELEKERKSLADKNKDLRSKLKQCREGSKKRQEKFQNCKTELDNCQKNADCQFHIDQVKKLQAALKEQGILVERLGCLENCLGPELKEKCANCY